eukprot:6668700-Lingulodinium_polyedra.AAC.1
MPRRVWERGPSFRWVSGLQRPGVKNSSNARFHRLLVNPGNGLAVFEYLHILNCLERQGRLARAHFEPLVTRQAHKTTRHILNIWRAGHDWNERNTTPIVLSV